MQDNEPLMKALSKLIYLNNPDMFTGTSYAAARYNIKNIMLSLQKNLSDHNVMGRSLYETLFVWNEFLTRGIRNSLQNTSWTVALVYGFFKQAGCHSLPVFLSTSSHKSHINWIFETGSQ
ncbi:hypothetical protein P8452_60979 [Trifolium repens]|nr:hypothetical protein P8452_60979 [Trifolium repens]